MKSIIATTAFVLMFVSVGASADTTKKPLILNELSDKAVIMDAQHKSDVRGSAHVSWTPRRAYNKARNWCRNTKASRCYYVPSGLLTYITYERFSDGSNQVKSY